MEVVVSARPSSLSRPAGSSRWRAGEPEDQGTDDVRPRLRPVERLLILLAVLGPGPYVFWRISDAYRYYMDDLLQFAVAQESGLSWHLLGLDVFQHFAPINRLAHLVLIRLGDFSLTAGQLAAAGLVVALQASLWWLLHELRVPFGRTLLGLVAVGFSITVLDTAVWADASLHILAALVATNLVLAAHVRAMRTGRRLWHAVSLVLFAIGTLTQERALFALPLMLMVDWFLLGAGEPVVARLRRLRTALVPYALITAVAVAVAVFIYVGYASGTKPRPGLDTVGRTVLGALTEGIFPPWVGIRLEELSPVPVQLAILAGLLVVAGVLIAIRRRNADPLAFLAAAFLLYFGFLVFSPILTEEVIDATALRLHNGAYLLVPTVLAVGFLRGRRTTPPEGAPARRVWPIALAAAGLAAVLVVVGGQYVRTHWSQERAAHAYLTALADGEPQWSDPDTTLVPLVVPQTIALGWAELYGRHEFFLRFYRPGWVGQPLGPDPVVLDAQGALRPVLLRTEAPLEETDPGRCGAEQTLLTAPRAASGEPLFLELTYTSDAPVDVRATPTARSPEEDEQNPNWAVPLEPGEHTVVIPLHDERVDGVLLGWNGPSEDTCVVSASIVRPVFDLGDGCEDMDVHGTATGRTACPVRTGD